jgi:PAS domain S-box-containing protein
MVGFANDHPIEPFLEMCAQHSAVLPKENELELSRAEERLRTIAELQQKTQALENALRLRQSEERFRLLVEAVQDYAIFMLDPAGYIVSWNAGAQRIKGYHAAEIIGRHFSCFYGEQDVANRKPQIELEVATRDGRLEDEGWRIRQDGSRFWASVVITAIRDESGTLVGFGKVTRDFTERMQAQKALEQEMRERLEAQQKLHESENFLRQLSRNLLRTQDDERRRIGRELHDTLGQSLAAMKIILDCVKPAVAENEVTSQRISECLQLADDAIREVRTISYLLYPPMLEEMGLQLVIGWYLDGFSARSGIQTTFNAEADFGRLSRDAELALFRVLQESLTNLHRHSGSRTAEIRLFTDDDMAILEVKDHGKGLANIPSGELSQDWSVVPGVGLRGMHERMLQLGGRLDLVSTPEGTTISALLPLEQCASPQNSASQAAAEQALAEPSSAQL